MPNAKDIAAVSFDFFNTLATQRHGRGRGALVTEYFRAQGWESDPWDHAALYDVFAVHGREYSSTMSDADLKTFSARVARTLFDRLHVAVDHAVADTHGVELRRILGPDHLVPFAETTEVLAGLRAAVYRIGAEKPDGRIFAEACRQLSLPAERVLHVGDTALDDICRARAAGLHALWLRRELEGAPARDEIRSLNDVPANLATRDRAVQSYPIASQRR